MFGFVADLSFRIVAAAAAVGLILTVLRVRSGAVRHAAWSAVLAAMLTMPLLIAVVPPITITLPATLALDRVSLPDPPDARTPASPAPLPASIAAPSLVPAVRSAASQPGPPVAAKDWRAVALVLYAAGLLFFGLRFAGGWHLARRLVAGATRVSVQNPVPVFESGAVAAPLTAGIRPAAVLLPLAWRNWPADTLEAVLAHENAHVLRRDALVAMLAHLNRAIFWFHPLAWWLERKLAVTAEHACDAIAARRLGDTHRYAGILLDIATTVQRRGRRVAWPAIGVDGSTGLDARIDRILSPDCLSPVSRARRFATAAACLAVLALAIACRQQIAVDPLREDPELAQRLAAEPALTKRFETSRDMTPTEADALEARIARNPDDWDARERLVTYYRMGRAVPWEKKVPGLRRHALWLIEHHPEHEVPAPPLSRHYDPDGFAAAVRLWESHLARPDVSPYLVHRAAQFFAAYDKPRAEQLFLRGLAMDPASKAVQAHMAPNVGAYQWPIQLATLYGAALIGADEPGMRRFNAGRVHDAFAMEVRKKLDSSNDAALLDAVGRYIVLGPPADAEIKTLGTGYLERALRLQPDFARARAALVAMRVRERHERFANARRQGKPVDEADRLAFLADQAQNALMAADGVEYYKKDEAAARGSRAAAVAHAQETLRLAGERRQDPAYSTAVATAHFVLSAAAMRDGDRERTVFHLQEAAKVPPSEEMTYYPQLGWGKPVSYLLKAGERARVIEFLEAFARVSLVERDRLLQDARAIREGRMPAGYQMMVARS